jgi:hypothetical protein
LYAALTRVRRSDDDCDICVACSRLGCSNGGLSVIPAIRKTPKIKLSKAVPRNVQAGRRRRAGKRAIDYPRATPANSRAASITRSTVIPNSSYTF